MYQLRDFVTKQSVSASNLVFTGEKNPWEVVMDLDEIKSKINHEYFQKSPPYVSKYLPFLPIKNYSQFVSLKEGATPLFKSKQIGPELGIDLHFKLEAQNPTGSFKDRGSAVELTIAKELGVKAIVLASTGNMAGSCSCYAAAAQIPCFIFIPEDTPASKVSQTIAYGGRIVQVKGTYNDAARMAKAVAEELGFYLAGDYAFRVEGQKTAAYELIDQSFFQVPDIVVVPIGCGTNITAYAKGFAEYKELGFIDRVPQLIGVEATGAASVVNAFNRGSRQVEPLASVDTIATAIAVADPLDGVKALDAIYSTNGSAIAVSDLEMLEAQYRLSRYEGLFVESSCAAALAAVIKLGKTQSFNGKKVVLILTGGGLKDPTTILKIAVKPPTIYPDIKDFLALYEKAFFDGNTVSFVPKENIIFESEPTTADLKRQLKAYFKTDYADEYVARAHKQVLNFLMKGKPVTFADLQDILQDILETPKYKTKAVFAVKDFEVTAVRDKKSKAKVLVEIDGSEQKGTGEGVGPVDAVINALRDALGGRIDFTLKGYKVDIRSQGTDAVVFVEIKLVKDNFVSLGREASPDIIQASIEAFEEAYNGFFSSGVER